MEESNKNESNPNVESRFEKRLLRCPVSKCNKPLAERKGNEIYLLKYQDGKPFKIKLEIQHYAGGHFKLSCDCGGGHIFASFGDFTQKFDVVATMQNLPVEKLG